VGSPRPLINLQRLIARFRSSEQGFIMLLTQGAMVLGTTVTVVLLVGTAAQLRSSGSSRERDSAYFTAKAAVEVALADLLQGQDISLPGYQPPPVSLNGVEAQVRVSTPPVGSDQPKLIYRYGDPGAKTALASLAPGQSLAVTLVGVQPFSTIGVNWAFADPTPLGTGTTKLSLELVVEDVSGLVVGKKAVAGKIGEHPARSPVQLFVRAGPSTKYVVRFKNTSKPDDKDAVAASSRPFSSLGGSDHTWMRAQMTGREYILRATATNAFVLKAYVRQIPGPSQVGAVPQLVVVETWRADTSGQ
jgi:hypothetical protein